ncbi:MAG: nitroreductase family protein [Bacillota bacterium]
MKDSLCMKRKSIRRFKKDEVKPELVTTLLRSAMQAPSAVNQQPWEFMVIRNQALLEELSQVSKGAWPLKGAPLGIVTMMRETGRKNDMRPQDMGACMQNLLLEATNQGLGGVWIGVYPLEDRMEKVRTLAGVPDPLIPFSMVAIGYPAEGEDTAVKERYDASRVHTRE